MYQALFIPADMADAPRWVEIHKYTDIQDLVGGNFDVIRRSQFTRGLIHVYVDCDMWVHDEGLILDLPLNTWATHITGLGVRGNVVMTGGADTQGNTLALDRQQGDDIIRIIRPLANRIAAIRALG